MPNEIAENVEAIDIGDGGRAVVRHNGKVIFIKGLVPGDIADIEIYKSKKRHAEGRLIKITKPSPNRVEPVCFHFGSCGGCSWQNLDYATQLALKQKQVEEAIKRIGGVTVEKTLPILGAESIYKYRNKLEFTFSNKRWLPQDEMNESNFGQPGLGFHVPRLFDKVIDIKECHLQPDPSNAIRMAVKEFAVKENMPFFNIRMQEGFLRNLMVRDTTTGELMVVFVFFKEDKEMREKIMNYTAEKFPQITSLLYIINPKKNDSFNDLNAESFKGQTYITEALTLRNGKKLNFRISPQSFFQTNTSQANALYAKVSEFAEFKGDEIVFDLYTGCGTIASFVSSEVKRVIGIEYVEQAVVDAKLNAQLNNITNTDFFAGDMKDMLTEEFCRHNGIPSVVITDPPRGGMHPDVINALLKILPEKIVYVSCNPSTQARDIALMSEKYMVKVMQPVDMFPHTSHVENVALLIKK
ncbi:MAG TPA: 23S rRNA (uracil(1939)-C(5))-methyltransferase RlmD [Bacteroidia bacterium]|jgi:23S rRNA (uracil1939-C5)-methyltransferase|nr:23S rRNA (uracil(1939)-C(5))-methyltransferase RlmD [Bacteroidia bacterium]